MTAHITWTYPTNRAAPDNSVLPPGTNITAFVYDTASATPAVAVAQQTGGPGAQGWLDLAVAPGSSHGFYVVDSDGVLMSLPTATVSATAPSAAPNPVSNLAVTFI